MENLKFITGKTYFEKFIGDADLKVEWLCISRTDKTVKFLNKQRDEIIKRKINEYQGTEYIRYGNYSMSSSIYADSLKK